MDEYRRSRCSLISVAADTTVVHRFHQGSFQYNAACATAAKTQADSRGDALEITDTTAAKAGTTETTTSTGEALGVTSAEADSDKAYRSETTGTQARRSETTGAGAGEA